MGRREGDIRAESDRHPARCRPAPSLKSFTLLPGPVPWTLFRDVLVVDGRPTRDAGRLAPLFRPSPGSGVRQAAEIARESEGLILGSTRRPLSVPTTALAYLHPDNRDRFRFGRRWPAEVDGQEVAAVEFEEIARPTLGQDGFGGDVAVRARLIREADGAVSQRTERPFDVGGSPGAIMTVTTEYRLVWRWVSSRRSRCRRRSSGARCRCPQHRGGGALHVPLLWSKAPRKQ
jgi:hypothetical protein